MSDEIPPPDEVLLRDEIALPPQAARPWATRPAGLCRPVEGNQVSTGRLLSEMPLSAFRIRWRVGLAWMIAVVAAVASMEPWIAILVLNQSPLLTGLSAFQAGVTLTLTLWVSGRMGWNPWLTALRLTSPVLAFGVCFAFSRVFDLLLFGLGLVLLPGLGRGLYDWVIAAICLQKLRRLAARKKLNATTPPD